MLSKNIEKRISRDDSGISLRLMLLCGGYSPIILDPLEIIGKNRQDETLRRLKSLNSVGMNI